MYVKCNSCSHIQFTSDYKWNGGKVRCNACGGSVNKTEEKKKESKK